jgi:ribosomal protein S18 acetylase RimI-like enzyme
MALHGGQADDLVSLRVWRASPGEARQVAALLAAFRDHMGGHWPADAAFLASVEKLIVRDDAEYLLAATGDGEPAQGVAQVRYRWGIWWDAEDCWLEDLYVAESGRGAGLGRALMEAVIERAAARGCRRVELDVNSENPVAMALYRSLGFETSKTGGQDLLMRRRL